MQYESLLTQKVLLVQIGFLKASQFRPRTSANHVPTSPQTSQLCPKLLTNTWQHKHLLGGNYDLSNKPLKDSETKLEHMKARKRKTAMPTSLYL